MNTVYNLSHIGTHLRANVLKTSTALALLASGCGLFAAGIAHGAEGQAGYLDFKTLLNGRYSIANGISADGKVIVGSASLYSGQDDRAFRWSSSKTGMVDLGILQGGSFASAQAVNANGTVVVGNADADNGYTHAVVWRNGVIGNLGTLNNGRESRATGVSADGAVIVGYGDDGAYNGPSKIRALRWTGNDQIESLGSLVEGGFSRANGISGDGKVIIGQAWNENMSDRAFRWTEEDQMVSLGTIASAARGVNYNGSVIVGYVIDNEVEHAFRWTAESGLMDRIGELNNGTYSSAQAVNADGSVVVGSAENGIGNIQRAFRWTNETGMISVEDWLRNNGATVAQDFTDVARGVSADGTIIVGSTTQETAFIARLSSEGTGIIEVEEFASSLAAKPSASVALSFAGTILNGAHGEPMRNLLDAGQQSVWVTSDIGYDNGAASDGSFGLGDFGYGIGLEGGATARMTFGGVYSDQDIETGGKYISKGLYISPEVTLPVAGNVYATIGAFYAPGKLTINRGYNNGGVMDYSRGETDVESWAAKLRLDWLNAATVNDWNLTPYASLTHARSKLDAYTETGGGFPAMFDEMRDHSTVLRAGVDGVHTLDNNIRLLARAEAAYRFENETAATSGSIIGLSDFSFDGQKTHQFWLRGGLGAEVDVASGTASMSVNVTTQGDDPTVWLRSGWKVKF
ncbi:putative HAF family extracellular repeat protein [Rhizobium sp. BIGb0125]|uniref:autotransporter domain-containing protein n=1 Tax=Rhizobium sp. BIGb0125 TaxID=2940618 RepID=UPI002169737A|nr:autotransporter domain-containing protein [Rhizobium sp. BIGb0125]MCS4242538.1 putative HAF family extracellular repeat protein [Rhizobium sp. BIGb0125]